MPDIDIDFANRDDVLNSITHRIATLENFSKHNTGVYVTDIPHNPLSLFATIDYKAAEDKGYFKLDFLNVSMYQDVRDEEHLQELIDKEPLWDLLLHDEFTDLLFHVNGHGDILRKLKPTSVEQLAAVLAIIRPAKRHLVDESWNTIMQEVWEKPTDGAYFFKKSHATAYAVAVKVQMNLLSEVKE